ncbi:serine protease inhibitor 42Dd-like isoform X2 [Drosophila bipectinata]|uniref:serine protease inhibitor 42Dd-like isoform X2 n=1 Tax=Drosophila bipectinata TaxID=42026 RepID=UPI0038B2A9BF
MARIACSILLLCVVFQLSLQLQKISYITLVSRILYYYDNVNMLVCPAAVEQSLMQIYLGSSGASERELKAALGHTGTSQSAFMESYRHSQSLLARQNPQYHTVSRLYTATSVKILPQYQKLSQQYLNITADNTLSAPGAKNINQWISSETNGKVRGIVDPLEFLSDSSKLLLVNANTFQGNWIGLRRTVQEKFFVPLVERHVPTTMLVLEGKYSYIFQQKLGAYVVIIPLGNSTMSMALIVPKTYKGIYHVEKNLQHLDLDASYLKYVRITLPRFKILYSQDMTQALIDVGVNHIFTHADLAHLTKVKEKLKVDSILQSNFIEVNEKGVSAGSASDFLMARSNLKISKILTVNRPFLFAIVKGKKIYFFGRFTRPNA